MREKIIRDPVHDVIALRIDTPDEGLLFKLLNAREFQRLRRIRQLGMASLAYPGAEHSRYSHSLGVMQVARRMLDHIGQSIRIDPADRTACLAAALLHDLGHGPLSHVFERVSGLEHESITQRIILDDQTDVHQFLAAHDPTLPQRVNDLIHCPPDQRTFLHDIITSQLDADRFDYLLRDNLMTGSRYGDFDLTWMLQHLAVENNRLAVSAKGVSAIETYLQGRYHMYRNVYFHKTVRSAEGMVRLVLQRAKRLAVQERLDWPLPDEPVHKALVGRQLSNREFIELDDVSVMHCLKVWVSGEDAVLAALCRGLLFRSLYKSIDLTRFLPDQAAEIRSAAAAAIVQSGGEAAYEMFYDEPADTPYDDPTGSNQIMIRDPAGRLTAFADISPLSDALNRQLMFRRIHFAAQHRPAISALLKGL